MAVTTEDTSATAQGEVRMLIGGELVEARSGQRFDNVNPATEEVLGQVADAGADDMDLAIGAARTAFDETTWSTDRAFRQRFGMTPSEYRAAARLERHRQAV